MYLGSSRLKVALYFAIGLPSADGTAPTAAGNAVNHGRLYSDLELEYHITREEGKKEEEVGCDRARGTSI